MLLVNGTLQQGLWEASHTGRKSRQKRLEPDFTLPLGHTPPSKGAGTLRKGEPPSKAFPGVNTSKERNVQEEPGWATGAAASWGKLKKKKKKSPQDLAFGETQSKPRCPHSAKVGASYLGRGAQGEAPRSPVTLLQRGEAAPRRLGRRKVAAGPGGRGGSPARVGAPRLFAHAGSRSHPNERRVARPGSCLTSDQTPFCDRFLDSRTDPPHFRSLLQEFATSSGQKPFPDERQTARKESYIIILG